MIIIYVKYQYNNNDKKREGWNIVSKKKICFKIIYNPRPGNL